MRTPSKAERIVTDMERVTPYMYEGLYGTFLRTFMDGDKSRWSHDLSAYLTRSNSDWEEVGAEMAVILWERFEKRISC